MAAQGFNSGGRWLSPLPARIVLQGAGAGQAAAAHALQDYGRGLYYGQCGRKN